MIIIEGKQIENNLYKLIGSTILGNGSIYSSSLSSEDTIRLWHMCLRHINEHGLYELNKRMLLERIK